MPLRDHIFSILSDWVVATLLSSSRLHTLSRIAVTGMVKAGLGTGPCQEQTEWKKLRVTCIAGIKPDDIPAEAWRRLTVNWPAQIPVWSKLTFAFTQACLFPWTPCVNSFLYGIQYFFCCTLFWYKKIVLQSLKQCINTSAIRHHSDFRRLVKRFHSEIVGYVFPGCQNKFRFIIWKNYLSVLWE